MTLTAGLGMEGGDLGRVTQPRIGAYISMMSECSLKSKPMIVVGVRRKESNTGALRT